MSLNSPNYCVENPITIHFIHESPTPHNNFLLDAVACSPNVTLFRHYLLSPTTVPGRPWKTMSSGDIQSDRIHCGYGRFFNWKLLKLALFDRGSVFFVIGWASPILVLFLFCLGLRRHPLIMWDDGPSPEALLLLKQYWRPKQAIKRLLINCINRTPGTYFYTGQVKLETIMELGIASSKTKMMPFFVKPGAAIPKLRENHLCNGESTLIVAGGRLIKEKGYDVFISALAMLTQMSVLNWKAVLIGSGIEREELTKLSVTLEISDRIDFVEWVEPNMWAAYIHTCDIFVAPARFDHFPTTVIAAMQAGVPVVATNQVGSAVEFIESGRNGIIVPPDSVKDLASALSKLICDAKKRRELGTAGQATILEWPVERGVKLIIDAARMSTSLSQRNRKC